MRQSVEGPAHEDAAAVRLEEQVPASAAIEALRWFLVATAKEVVCKRVEANNALGDGLQVWFCELVQSAAVHASVLPLAATYSAM